MRTNVLTIQQIKQYISEIMINKTSKISKVSDESVVNAVLYGMAKPLQKGIKDVAVLESNLFPEFAYGQDLDIIAARQGVLARFGASASSTFVRLVATPGTTYVAATNIMTSSGGFQFILENDINGLDPVNNSVGYQNYQDILNFGYTYAKVQSVDSGSNTNVPPASISMMASAPTGHKYVVNEYTATGGRDVEQDDVFRVRIQQTPNFLTAGTLNKYTNIFQQFNPDVLRVVFAGINDNGILTLAIITQNGIALSDNDIDNLLNFGNQYFSLTEQRLIGTQSVGLSLINAFIFPIDVSFRVELYNNISPDTVMQNIQLAFGKYLDFRFWDYTSTVQWVNLINIVKNANGVKYVPDKNFLPNNDITVPIGYVPRIRGFIMQDLDGNIIQDSAGNLNPVYYTGSVDNNFGSIISTINL